MINQQGLEPDRDTRIFVHGNYYGKSKKWQNRLVLTNSIGEITIFLNSGVVYETGVEFVIPYTWAYSNNFSGTASADVKDEDLPWKTVREFVLAKEVTDNTVSIIQGGPLEVTVLNPGSGGGGTFPDYYPLPGAQLSTLTPQKDGLTNSELRAAPVVVSINDDLKAILSGLLVQVSSGEISLDSSTIDALQNVVVSGEVSLDAATLSALETISAVVSGTVGLDSPTVAALKEISNFPNEYPLPASQVSTLTPQKNALTNDELRSTPIDVNVDFPNTYLLDDDSKTALNGLLVQVQSGEIALDSDTLSALENITVSGQVSLDSATLAALENINAAVSGTVALDSGTIAALQNVIATVSGTVSISNLPSEYPLPQSQIDALTSSSGLTDDELRASPLDIRAITLLTDSIRQTLIPSTAYSNNTVGPVSNQVLVDVPADKKIRLIRNAGHIDPAADPEEFPLVVLKIGSTIIYKDKLEAGMPWSETVCFEGALGEDLLISIDTNTTVYLNMRYEIF